MKKSRLTDSQIIEALKQIIAWRDKPQAIRCDNGSEYLRLTIIEWPSQSGVKLAYTQPDKPQQNAGIKRFNRTCATNVCLNKTGMASITFSMLQPNGCILTITNASIGH